MARAQPAITSFAGGEITPLLHGRTDLARYGISCRRALNFLILPQGPARFRGGTRHMGLTRQGRQTWLSRFVFSTSQSYLLLWTDRRLQFFTRLGQITNPDGTGYVIETPFEDADLEGPNGRLALRFAQQGDLLWIACRSARPRQLARRGITDWTLETYDFAAGPVADENDDPAVTIRASTDQSGAEVTLTASRGIFYQELTGGVLRLSTDDPNGVRPWEAGQTGITVGQQRRSDGKIYEALTAGICGNIRPVHIRGNAFDAATGGVQWRYRHAGTGFVRLTGYASPTQMRGTIEAWLPRDVVTDGTWRWSFPAWDRRIGFPDAVAMWRERLWFARDRTIWASVAGNVASFAGETRGEVLATSAITATLSGEQDRILWLLPQKGQMLIGTAGKIYVLRAGGDGPIAPDNLVIEPHVAEGSAGLEPVSTGTSALYLERGGRALREIAYDLAADQLVSSDLSVMAQHMLVSPIIDWTWQGIPERTLWALTQRSELVALTYQRDQEVVAWHRHDVGGEIEALETLPTTLGDQVFMVVRRGGGIRALERLMDPSEGCHLHASLTYEGDPVTAVSGLQHLNGVEVDIVADGLVLPRQRVAGGQVTLQKPAGRIDVGIHVDGVLEPMPVELADGEGTAQGRLKRIGQLIVRVDRSAGGKVGPDESNLVALPTRTTTDALDRPVPLATGDRMVTFPGKHDRAGRITIVQDQPLPLTILALYPRIVTESP